MWNEQGSESFSKGKLIYTSLKDIIFCFHEIQESEKTSLKWMISFQWENLQYIPEII